MEEFHRNQNELHDLMLCNILTSQDCYKDKAWMLQGYSIGVAGTLEQCCKDVVWMLKGLSRDQRCCKDFSKMIQIRHMDVARKLHGIERAYQRYCKKMLQGYFRYVART